MKNKEKESILGEDLIPVDFCSVDVYYLPDEKKYKCMIKMNNPGNRDLYIFCIEEDRNWC